MITSISLVLTQLTILFLLYYIYQVDKELQQLKQDSKPTKNINKFIDNNKIKNVIKQYKEFKKHTNLS